jgi:hypothetical protein
LPCKCNGCRDADQAARDAGQLTNAGKAAGDLFVVASRVLGKPLTGFRQAHAARGALHQRDARGALQLGNTLAHCGLADTQPRSRRGIAALLCENGEPVQMDPQALNFFVIHTLIVRDRKQ